MPLTRLFKMSLTAGKFPDVFKQACVTPPLKKLGLDKLDYANYRSMSNHAFPEKVLERIVLTHLNQHLSAEQVSTHFRAHISAIILLQRRSRKLHMIFCRK